MLYYNKLEYKYEYFIINFIPLNKIFYIIKTQVSFATIYLKKILFVYLSRFLIVRILNEEIYTSLS